MSFHYLFLNQGHNPKSEGALPVCNTIAGYVRVTSWNPHTLRYCSDVCSGITCYKGNEITSDKNDYLSHFF